MYEDNLSMPNLYKDNLGMYNLYVDDFTRHASWKINCNEQSAKILPKLNELLIFFGISMYVHIIYGKKKEEKKMVN